MPPSIAIINFHRHKYVPRYRFDLPMRWDHAGEARMKLLVSDQELSALRAQAATAHAPETQVLLALTELCWHLRQRHPLEAERQADDIERRLDHIDSTTRMTLRARLELVRAEIDLQFGRSDSARHRAESVRMAAQALRATLIEADALYMLGHALHDEGRRDDSTRAMSSAAMTARVFGDETRAQFIDATEAVYAAGASVAAAQARWGDAVETWLGSEEPVLRAAAGDFAGTVALSAGENSRCIELLPEVVYVYRYFGQERRAVVCVCNLTGAFSNLLDHAGALEWITEAIERARPTGVPRNLGICLIQSAHTLYELGKYEAARDQILEARDLLSTLTRIGSYTVLLQVLGEIEMAQGRHSEALDAFKAQEEHALGRGSAIHQVLALRQQMEVLREMGQTQRSVQIGRTALSLVRMQGNRLVEAEVLQAMATVHGHANLPAPAGSPWADGELHYLHEAEDAWSEVRAAAPRAELLELLGKAHARTGDLARAYGYGSAAFRAFQQAHSEESMNRAATMEVRHKTARARAEAELQSRLAKEQSARAEELTRMNETLSLLGAVGREVTAHLDDRRVFEALSSHLAGLLDATSFAVFLLAPDGCRLELAYGVEEGREVHVEPFDVDDPYAGTSRCARSRELVLLTRPTTDVATQLQVPHTLKTRSALYAPLEIGDRLLGVLTLQSARPDAYGERELLIVRTLAAYGAIAIDNSLTWANLNRVRADLERARGQVEQRNAELERANESLSELSITDALTGLHNRRFLHQQLDADVALCLRAYADAAPGSPDAADLAFFMIDVDHFKPINDLHGHDVGDEVLIELKRRLIVASRNGDYVVRWGGEEFCVVARHLKREHAHALGERLREAIAMQDFHSAAGKLRVTVSIGVACFPAATADPCAGRWEDALSDADRAMYRAKHSGRNAVCSAELSSHASAAHQRDGRVQAA